MTPAESTPSQVPTGAHEQLPRLDTAENENVLAGLPIETVGQVDPLNPDHSLGFPHVLYHGTKAEDFNLDDTKNHRTAFRGTGARAGGGLYAASESVSQSFGSGTIIELIPHEAQLLDLDAPEAKMPLTEDFQKAYIEDAHAGAMTRVRTLFPDVAPSTIAVIWRKFESSEELITKTDVRDVATKAKEAAKTDSFGKGRNLAQEIASQVNLVRIMQQMPDVSLQELFAAYDPINGETRVPSETALDIAPMIDFLTARGVDGAKTVQRFDGEQGVVFWKLDNVGERKTWERRLEKAPADLGHLAVSETATEAEDDDPHQQELLETRKAVGRFLRDEGIDLQKANENFEDSAQRYIQNVRETASAERRDLTPKEVATIKNIVELVTSQRQLQTQP